MQIPGYYAKWMSHSLWGESRIWTFNQEIPVLADIWDPLSSRVFVSAFWSFSSGPSAACHFLINSWAGTDLKNFKVSALSLHLGYSGSRSSSFWASTSFFFIPRFLKYQFQRHSWHANLMHLSESALSNAPKFRCYLPYLPKYFCLVQRSRHLPWFLPP